MTTGLLIVLAALLVIIVILFGRTLRGGFVANIALAIRQLSDAAAHHAQINAVLALTESFQSDPSLVQKLSGYSHQVVGAALLHRVNTLGNDLKKVQEKLSDQREAYASRAQYSMLLNEDQRAINHLEALESYIFAELKAADNAVQAFGRLRSVS